MNEYVGNLHVHTVGSDGTKDSDALARIAAEAGLDFLVLTDHNVLSSGHEGYREGVLVLTGQEIHDTVRKPQASHYLALRLEEDVSSLAGNMQAVVDEVRRQGGLGFVAHPFEHAGRLARGEPEINWKDWHVGGYHGIEIWNYMSEFKSHVTSMPKALLMAYCPRTGMVGPFAETLARWDHLLEGGKRVVAIGGSDAHGTVYRLGPLERSTLPYEVLFRAVNTHILSDEPMTGLYSHDRTVVYDALERGRCYVGYDLLKDARGFRFTAKGGELAQMGDECTLRSGVHLEAQSPYIAHLRLVRHGKVLVRTRGKRLSYEAREPGAYRVEAYRRCWGKLRAWVLTNPIYVRQAA